MSVCGVHNISWEIKYALQKVVKDSDSTVFIFLYDNAYCAHFLLQHHSY